MSTPLDSHVLAAVQALGDNAYGRTIWEEVERRIGEEVVIGSIYASIDRLADKGLVTTRVGEATAERGWRPKLYVDITPAGMTACEPAEGTAK